MFEITFNGISKTYKKKTKNVQGAFEKLAEELRNDLYLGGVDIVLRKGKAEATISLSSKKMFLFKNNPDTRQFTEDYLVNQLNEITAL